MHWIWTTKLDLTWRADPDMNTNERTQVFDQVSVQTSIVPSMHPHPSVRRNQNGLHHDYNWLQIDYDWLQLTTIDYNWRTNILQQRMGAHSKNGGQSNLQPKKQGNTPDVATRWRETGDCDDAHQDQSQQVIQRIISCIHNKDEDSIWCSWDGSTTPTLGKRKWCC